jgi:hypothetical protein
MMITSRLGLLLFIDRECTFGLYALNSGISSKIVILMHVLSKKNISKGVCDG